jgi:hypothetical protein
VKPSALAKSLPRARVAAGITHVVQSRRVCLVVLTLACGVWASPASAAPTFTVTAFGDPAGATCAATVCGSVRAALTAAEQPANVGSIIALGGGTYTLGGGAGNASGALSVTQNTTITGTGRSATTIEQTDSGTGMDVLNTSPTAAVSVANLTITGGNATGVNASGGAPGGDAAGAIIDAGALTLSNVAVTGNKAHSGNGGAGAGTSGAGGTAIGAIEVSGALTLQLSAVTANTGTGGAGGFSATTAAGGQGGLAVAGILVEPGAGPVTIIGSDLSGNTALGGVGGIGSSGAGGVGGPGGAASGALADLGGSAVSITQSTLNGNTVTGGTGGAGSIATPGAGPGGVASGGGIDATAGPVTVTDVSIAGNTLTGGGAGASTASPNHGGGAQGGGIAARGATVAVERATIALNTVTGGAASPSTVAPPPAVNRPDAQGGGLYADSASSFVNVTVVQNSATGGPGNQAGNPGSGFGGGISIQGSGLVTLASDTFASNAVAPASGPQTGGANLNDAASVQVAETIFSDGQPSGNCAVSAGHVTDLGHNLESTTPSGCGLTSATDRIGVGPQLGPLADLGGVGQTLAPAPGSPARGAGGQCTDPSQTGNPLLTTDERGTARHTVCDIGAYETQPPAVGAAPTLPGRVTVGAVLTCPTTGVHGDAPLSVAFSWRRAGSTIAGATTASYTTAAKDVNKTVACAVTATNVYGSASATSNATAVTPKVRFTGARLGAVTVDRHGHIRLKLSCPQTAPGGRCRVALSVYGTTGRLPASVALAKKKKRRPAARLARGSVRIRAGTSVTHTLKLDAAGRHAFRHLPAHARVVFTSRAGTAKPVTRSKKVTVRAGKRARRRAR